MLIGFICPDKKEVLLDDCFTKCRLGERCLTLPTLKKMSQEREWNGVASTTQLLNGTMLEYLKLTIPYYVDPQSRIFMLEGTRHHAVLEEVAKDLGLAAEVALSIDRDIFDLIEMEDDGLVLTDYKLWGSFKVAKALGIVEMGKEPDPNGEVYKSSGKWGKAGSPKMVPYYAQVPEKANNWEAEYQLNRYRVKLENLGVKLNRMQLQVTVRDGGLYVAHNRGVFMKAVRIPIPFIDNSIIEAYFKYKDDCLKQALMYGWSQPCTDAECWDGRRCSEYCDLASSCPRGQATQGGG